MSPETAAESTARLGEAGEKPGPALISRVSCFTHRGGKLGKTVIMLQQTTTGLPLDESGGRDQLGAAAVCRATNGRATVSGCYPRLPGLGHGEPGPGQGWSL